VAQNRSPILRSIILCFNPNFYPTVLRQSGWQSLVYLGFVCLIVYGFIGYRERILFDRYEKEVAQLLKRALPDFNFVNGQSDYPPDEPHIYEEKFGENSWTVVVDTSGETERLGEECQAGILITKTEIVYKAPGTKESRKKIPRMASKVPAEEYFMESVRMQRPSVPLFYLFHLAGKVIVVAMVAGIFLLADKGKREPYPFAYYFNVTCYAITPFVLSALVRTGWTSRTLGYASFGASLMLFLALGTAGLARCRQEEARERLAEQEGESPRTDILR
jgi:hypothetical protein